MSTADLGAEREIDLSRWKQAAVERWWVVVGGLVAGAVVGYLLALSGGSVYEASALVAPGQAFSANGSPVLTYQSSPRGIQAIVTGESAIERAAAAAHMPVSELRGHVTTSTVSTGASASTAARGSNLIQITVQAQKKKWAEDAANALLGVVVTDTEGQYVKKSIAIYNSKIASYNAQLDSLQNLIQTYNHTLSTQHLDFLTKLILVTQLDAAIARQGNLNDKLTATQQQLTLAQNIEIAQPIERAAAFKTTARSRRNSTLVGGLIGVIAGFVLAVVLDVRSRRAAP
ncbi:MAG TPA: hypothetical protein VE987_20805 [Polyangiaceae bacterium]|jgi:capsular polysaccharide biosynthesis protein|nr:hypothetical protein [Polyangiaceae bacterium]